MRIIQNYMNVYINPVHECNLTIFFFFDREDPSTSLMMVEFSLNFNSLVKLSHLINIHISGHHYDCKFDY